MTEKKRSTAYSMFVIGALFFVFGFVTWINNILIPYMTASCELTTQVQGYLVTFAFYIAYFVMSIPSSYVLKRTGYGNGMALGLIIMAIGCIMFVPGAMSRSYPLFLLGLFLQGSGLSFLQTASNPYVTVLGPVESAARRMSIMGVCNKLAGMIGILLLPGRSGERGPAPATLQRRHLALHHYDCGADCPGDICEVGPSA